MRPPKQTQALSIGDVLRGHGEGIDVLARRAGALEQVAKTLKAALPPAVAGQVHVGNVRDGTLVVIVPSPAIASRIRIDAARIMSMLEKDGLPLQSVQAKVRPGYVPPGQRAEPSAPRTLPEAARRALLDLASSCDDDPHMQESLRALANVGALA